MKVLVINAGSSSLKYQLMDTTDGSVLGKGLCERIGIAVGSGALEHKKSDGTKIVREVPLTDHTAAVKLVLSVLVDKNDGCIASLGEIEAVGHRIVHGGAYFFESCLYSPTVRLKIEECSELAPLHNPANLMGVDGCMAVLPNVPHVLVFDTAFHQTMGREVYTYALNYELSQKYKIRRYGFHGTSHRYVSGIMTGILGRAKGTKIITCHLGNGSSITAIKDGRVVDTSMGLTPLAGVEMGTRCGDIDPAIVTFVMKKEGINSDKMDEIMNKKSGLASISGVSSDCRDIRAAMNEGNDRAKLAFDILYYHIKKYIGAYTAAMNGLDALVFTAGIGENDWRSREQICKNLEYLGIEIDPEANKSPIIENEAARLSSKKSRVGVYMIPTNEELAIALDAEALAGKKK